MEHIQEKQPPDVITSDTDNQTKFNPREAPPDKQHQFKILSTYNKGLWNGPRRENKKLMHRQDDLHIFDSISSQLDLTPYQKKRGRHLLDTFSVREYTTPNRDRTVYAVIFALCIVVANADVRKGNRYWPHPDAKSNDPEFERVAENIETDWRDLVSLVMKLDHNLEV